MIPSKKEFCEIIQQIKNYEEYTDAMLNINRKYGIDYRIDGIPIVTTLLSLLKIVFQDDGDYISWWVWEVNFGENCKKGPVIWESNGKPIDVSNSELFYDFLIENINLKKKGEDE